MASGKSTIGKELAKKLYIKFIDLDEYIENNEKMSVSAIFKNKGEIYFRRIEHTYLKEILNSDEKFVLSLGGGTPCYANNMHFISNTKAVSLYLKTSIKTLAERLVSEKSRRPLVADLTDEKITEFVAKHLFERRFYYEQANFTLNIDNKSLQESIAAIRILLH
jgi:shikimate kinase